MQPDRLRPPPGVRPVGLDLLHQPDQRPAAGGSCRPSRRRRGRRPDRSDRTGLRSARRDPGTDRVRDAVQQPERGHLARERGALPLDRGRQQPLRVPVEGDVELVTFGDQRRRPLVRSGARRGPRAAFRVAYIGSRQPRARRTRMKLSSKRSVSPTTRKRSRFALASSRRSDAERRRLRRGRPCASRARPRPSRREARLQVVRGPVNRLDEVLETHRRCGSPRRGTSAEDGPARGGRSRSLWPLARAAS